MVVESCMSGIDSLLLEVVQSRFAHQGSSAIRMRFILNRLQNSSDIFCRTIRLKKKSLKTESLFNTAAPAERGGYESWKRGAFHHFDLDTHVRFIWDTFYFSISEIFGSPAAHFLSESFGLLMWPYICVKIHFSFGVFIFYDCSLWLVPAIMFNTFRIGSHFKKENKIIKNVHTLNLLVAYIL